MAKSKVIYVCASCGYESPKWLGRCPGCEAWNSFSETRAESSSRAERGGEGEFFTLSSDGAVTLSALESSPVARFGSDTSEFDRVLGGGFVPGSLVLLGGDPGIGKSTLILEAANAVAKSGRSVLYVSGEESAAQLKLRADRLGASAPSLYILTTNELDLLFKEAKTLSPALVIVDSIQTVYLQGIDSAPGSVVQVRECTGKLLYFSKSLGIATVIVGHVTKEGALAGPRVLEHMVDTVLYFEGDSGHGYRILRTTKNRYGSTNEIGVFEMSGKGLLPVENPSRLFLSERPKGASGSVVMAAMEGLRPLLVEIQALVSGSGLVNPRRTAIGTDSARVALLVAVLEKIVGLQLYDQDIYVNVAGGLRIAEPAADLALLAALASSFKTRAIDAETVVFGEVGLAGEVRAVSAVEARLNEARKLGFKRCILPKANEGEGAASGLALHPVKTVREALDALF